MAEEKNQADKTIQQLTHPQRWPQSTSNEARSVFAIRLISYALALLERGDACKNRIVRESTSFLLKQGILESRAQGTAYQLLGQMATANFNPYQEHETPRGYFPYFGAILSDEIVTEIQRVAYQAWQLCARIQAAEHKAELAGFVKDAPLVIHRFNGGDGNQVDFYPGPHGDVCHEIFALLRDCADLPADVVLVLMDFAVRRRYVLGGRPILLENTVREQARDSFNSISEYHADPQFDSYYVISSAERFCLRLMAKLPLPRFWVSHDDVEKCAMNLRLGLRQQRSDAVDMANMARSQSNESAQSDSFVSDADESGATGDLEIFSLDFGNVSLSLSDVMGESEGPVF